MQVALIVGSKSDVAAAKGAIEVLERFGVDCHPHVCSAHRAPERLREVVRSAESGGAKLFIAGAGMAAALPGAVASMTTKPVIGLPLAAGALNGIDALLAIAQMPPGVPVATVAINGAANAGYLALEILALNDSALAGRLADWRREQAERVDSFE
ncbi:MAG TPA: 5-(carboxyamino)imidazole ribonucleotide mutase [Chloroflexota bacterium]|nr:5-(carboxyamino)imidazole ribonucleotide mutase [Chloroflexota bacterium]